MPVSDHTDSPICGMWIHSTNHAFGLKSTTSADINSLGEIFYTFQVFLFTTLAILAASDLTIKEAFSIVLSTTTLASNLVLSANSSIPGSLPDSKITSSTNTAGAIISLRIVGYTSNVYIADISSFSVVQIV